MIIPIQATREHARAQRHVERQKAASARARQRLAATAKAIEDGSLELAGLEEVPPDFRCPLCDSIMLEPTLASDGRVRTPFSLCLSLHFLFLLLRLTLQLSSLLLLSLVRACAQHMYTTRCCLLYFSDIRASSFGQLAYHFEQCCRG